ncbi:MAG: hypothetical protein HOP15_12080 [Planctomycetes bacterium]|nr:hypothetical protein [Planctomycetota bacterium]
MTGHLEPVEPIPGHTTDVGVIVIDARRRTLVFGDAFTPHELQDEFVGLGYAIVRQRHLPLELAPYEAIWFMGTEALDEAMRARLVEFVARGGGLYLSSRPYPFSVAEKSVEMLLEELVPGTSVRFGQALASNFTFQPGAIGELTSLPHDIVGLEWRTAHRALIGPSGANVLTQNSRGEVGTAAWQDDELVAGRGRLVVAGTQSSLLRGFALDNLQSFLANRAPTALLGMVRLANGAPVRNATIQLMTHGIETRSSGDGSFFIAAVSSRHGPIEATARAEIGPGRCQGWTTVAPGEHGLTSLEIVIDPRPLALLFGTHPQPSGDLRPSLANDLVALGVPVERVRSAAKLPRFFGAFTVVWHAGAVAITASQRQQLVAFVRAGGALHLSGERRNEASLNPSLELLLDELGIDGVQLGRNDVRELHFVAEALHGLSSSPNPLTTWNAEAPGRIAGIAARNILAQDQFSRIGAAAWDEADLVGRRGRVTLLMDLQWLGNPASERLPILENLMRFLEQRLPPLVIDRAERR